VLVSNLLIAIIIVKITLYQITGLFKRNNHYLDKYFWAAGENTHPAGLGSG
jgi:hypothetical protein